MQDLMPPVNTPDKLFHDGDPSQGIEGTIVNAEFMNNEQGAIRDSQQELINILKAANMDPDPSKSDQVITALQALFLTVSAGSVLPIGVPVPWPLSNPPEGWLKCNGATFTSAQFPKLALAYPALKLPDLRGEFVRGWDDGRGVDLGRGILSTQAATKLPSVYTLLGTGSVGTLVTPPINSYPGSNSEIRASDYETETTGSGSYLSTGQNQLTASGSSGLSSFRVRPRNVAFSYIVRAA